MLRGSLVDQSGVEQFRGRRIALEVDGRHRRFNIDGDVKKLADPTFAVLGLVDVIAPVAADRALIAASGPERPASRRRCCSAKERA